MAYQQLRLDQVTVAATGFKGPEGVTVDREVQMESFVNSLRTGRSPNSHAREVGLRAWRLIARAISLSVMLAKLRY